MKKRHITAALIVAASIAVTPAAVREAYQFRGQMAFGGEDLIIPLGFIIAFIVLDIAKIWDTVLSDIQKEEEKKYGKRTTKHTGSAKLG